MLSVIIPVYNTEKYLSRCVDSVLNQTYRDLEIILVDDGSTDGCSAICDEYAKKDSRVKAFHQVNGGQSSARNFGLKEFKGDYLTFLDSDDWLDLDTYEQVFLKIQDTDADMVMFNFVEEHKNGKKECVIDKEKYNDTNAIKLGFMWDHIGSYCRNVYQRKLWENITFPLNCYYEDLAMLIDVVMKAKHIEIIDRCLYHYDFTFSNSTTTNWSAKSKYGMFMGALKRIKYAEKWNEPKVKQHFLKRAYKTCVTGLSMNLLSNQLWSDQVREMNEFLNSSYVYETKKIGIKYRLLRWGLKYSTIVPMIYAQSMTMILQIKKRLH